MDSTSNKDDFDTVIAEYSDAFKIMDILAKNKLRAFFRAWARNTLKLPALIIESQNIQFKNDNEKYVKQFNQLKMTAMLTDNINLTSSLQQPLPIYGNFPFILIILYSR